MKNYLLLFIYLTAAFSSIIYPQQKKVNYRRDAVPDSALLITDPYQYSNIHRSGNTVWTELNPKVPRTTYLSIYFTCADTGWSVGDGGAIIKTTDGGASWVTKSGNSTVTLLCVNSFDEKTVIATGFNGTILRSEDAGENWTQVQSNVTGDLWSVQMTGRYTGWICGLNSALLKTTDGGLTWEHVSTGFPNNYWALKFINNTGYITCNGGNILKTTDTGLTWSQKSINYAYNLYCLHMFDSLNFMAAGYHAVIAKTTDGGETFTYNYGGDDINSITFANDSIGCVYGLNSWVYYRTTNRGATWTWTSSQNIGEYCGVFINDSIGYNCGEKIKINKTTDVGASWNRLINNDDFRDVYFSSPDNGFITSGQLYHTNDGGHTLTPVPYNEGGQSTFINGQEIFFIDSLVGLIGGNHTIYRTSDEGNNWSKITAPLTSTQEYYVNSFSPSTHNVVWAINCSKIICSTNKGETWNLSDFAGYYSKIFFLDSLHGWIGVLNSKILKTTNGGNTWLEIPINAYEIADIYFRSNDVGYILSDRKFYRTTNSGYDWYIDSTVINYGVLPGKFKWFDAQHGLIIGSSATLETNDSGKTWLNITGQLGYCLSNFRAATTYLGYGISTGGLLVSYYNDSYTPVVLTSFNVYEENDKIICRWNIAEESEISGYGIEKSFDGISWNTAGFVPAKKLNSYSFIDNAEGISKIYYRIKIINFDGKFNYTDKVEFNNGNKKFHFQLSQNFPNPFNSTTNIQFYVPELSDVKIELFNILGKKVMDIISRKYETGSYNLQLSLVNLASGVYLYKMTATGQSNKVFEQTNKLIILK